MNKEYLSIYNHAKSIVDTNLPLFTNLSNLSAVLNELDNINWCGFYIAKDDALYLGPFQGEVACSKIPFNKGICGRAYTNKETVIIDNVLIDKDHIACSSASRSEIVTPILVNNLVVALIDIDSPVFNRFNSEDKELLESISILISDLFK